METINIGDILLDKWGYSMTINSFYQVTRKTAKCVFAREIKNRIVTGAGFTGEEEAIPDAFLEGDKGKERRFTPRGDYFAYAYSVGSRHTARKWDGQPTYYNSMD